MGGACSSYGLYTVLRGNLRERDHLGDPGLDWRIFRKWDVGVWTESIWLTIETGGWHLCLRGRFHKIW